MEVDVKMPKWGLTMDKGTISNWLKVEGDEVEKGEVIVEIDVDKSLGEVEAPTHGFLRKVMFEEGDEVSVGDILAIISTND